MRITSLMGRLLFAGIVSGAFLIVACNSPSANPSDYIGEYVFTPYHASPGQFADFVIFKPDGTAVEIRFSKPTGQIATTEENWHLDYTNEQDIIIGKRVYPIESHGDTIKLNVNSDLGQYYVKIR